MKYKVYLIFTCAIILLTAMQTFADYKIKQRMTMNGQTSESTIYVKGSRKRTESGGYMGMGADVATIEQCDMQRTIQLNDGKKLYFIQPFADVSDSDNSSAIQNPQSPNQKGGTVTMSYVINDTGERKQMFGLTARHIKTVMTMQASADACSPIDMRVETDGWYIDLPQFSCPWQAPTNPMMRSQRAGCQDKTVVKQSGSGKLGFPLSLTQTFGDSDMTQIIEIVEFSSATLEAAMFDVPKEYAAAKSSQELYDAPDINAITQNMNGNSDSMSSSTIKPASAQTKKPGTIRIGVLALANKTSESIPVENLRSILIQKLAGATIEAVAVNSESDARAMSCDYVLSANVSKLKQSASSKVGGMFGKVTGVDTSAAQKYEVQIDYRLLGADGQMVLQNQSIKKDNGTAEAITEAAVNQAVPAILNVISRKN